ncbi:hypothetical protein D3C71_1861600 [compost metagenome]
MGHADFTHQGQATGAHDLIEEMCQGGLELGHFLAAITVQVGTRRGREQRSVGQRATQRTYTREQNVGGVQLHRRIRTVADLALPRRAGRQGGGEAEAVEANVFRVLDEVLRIAGHQQWPERGERSWQ